MSISRSTTSGDSWEVLANVWPGPSGYSGLAVMPAAFGPPALGILYNRGTAGDGCFGTACPYSTDVTFAVIPLTEGSLTDSSLEAKDTPPLPALAPVEPKPLREADPEPLMSFGWWCSVNARPDLDGMLDNHQRIVTTATPPPCDNAAECIAALRH